MAYTPQEGSGAIFKNNKGDNPARPDYRGDIMLGGVLYEVAGWIKPKPADPSEKYMSLVGKPKDAAKPAAKPARQPAPVDDFNDDMPF
jgi:hypothetical protein